MRRFATIDVGTNSVLLLVAERNASGTLSPLLERAEITRLGRGVDQSNELSEPGINETVAVIKQYVRAAQELGVDGIAMAATSAARDAANGAVFLARVKRETGIEVQIISGGEEARLSFNAAWAEFGRQGTSLIVIDIGGGSTEFIYGQGYADGPHVRFRQSYNVGSVRLTERFVTSHPIAQHERSNIAAFLHQTFSELPEADAQSSAIGLAGTVTTLFAIQHRIEPFDSARVQGGILTLNEVAALASSLASLGLEDRKCLPGLQPKRADVIPVGAMILQSALEKLKIDRCIVSDRGLRWGLLTDHFGATVKTSRY